jgi:UDP-N-acetylglucosamine--N-acetylmuramyl-(pentapeptide) pyrophosphoryl-undecaprenol N-acetylglucosamine transferase
VGGGTAGHVEPALAVGTWLLGKSSDIACEFIGTKSGIENELVPLAGLKLHHIQKAPLPRSLALATLLWPFKFGVSVLQALRIVKSADLVIGFGGYVSAPCYVAAKISGVPLIIHEANAIPGWANKLGAKFADEVLVAFKSSLNIGGAWARAKLVGMPIREEIFAVSNMSKSERSGIWDATYRELGLDRSKRTLFIFGGSLGAQSINKAIEQVLPELLKLDINIIHGIGRGNALPKAIPDYVPLSYISNMAAMYIASDLVIARGGAVTCAELDVTNSFALIIPLPIGNGEQVANAQDLVAKGAAEICLNSDFTSNWLLANIDHLISKADSWNIKKSQTTTTPSVEIIGEIVLKNLVGISK